MAALNRSSGGGSAVGIIALVIGGYLIDSGIKGRQPITALMDTIQAGTAKGANAGTIKAAFKSTSGALASGAASGSGGVGTTPQPGSPTNNAAVNFALAQVGKPYRWGATGPDAFDCSGLVWAAYRAAGGAPRIRWTTYTMLASLPSVPKSWKDLQPGDLVFPDAGHVVMVVDPNSHMIVESPKPGESVRTFIYDQEYKSIFAARRVQ